jgi:hypothetical protein
VSARAFDKKFGPGFFETVPDAPGVYEWLSPDGQTLYVGKAANLKKRLRQYRTAGRKKVERKRAELVRVAAAIRFKETENELAALLLENELIQKLRPPHNVAGAFTFLYPCIGVRLSGKDVDLCCTTSPDQLPDFEFTGAFRSPKFTRAAFDSLVELLEFVGHREPTRRVTDLPKVDFTRVVRFRQLDAAWVTRLLSWLRGASSDFLKHLLLALLEKQAARRHAEETQAQLEFLKRFWLEECVALREALRVVGRDAVNFVTQAERDPLFLTAQKTGPAPRDPRRARASRR